MINKIKKWIADIIIARKTIFVLTQDITRLREEKTFVANDFDVNGVMLPIILAHYYAIPRLIEQVNKKGGNFHKWDADRNDIEKCKKIKLKACRRFGG